MALLSSLKQIASVESSSVSQKFMPEFFKLVLGTLSLPIDLPSTNYRQGLDVSFLISIFGISYKVMDFSETPYTNLTSTKYKIDDKYQ